jgi:hypothetical protein
MFQYLKHATDRLISGTVTQVRLKVKLSLCLINETARHEDVWGSRGIAPFFISVLDGSGQLHAPAALPHSTNGDTQSNTFQSYYECF